MDKKFLFLIGLAFVLIFAVGFLIMPSFLSGNKNNEEVSGNEKPPYGNLSPAGKPGTGETVSGNFTVKKDTDGWQMININKEQISIKIPGDWQINANADNYLLKAAFNKEKAQVSIIVDSYDDSAGLSPDKWAKQYRGVASYKQITRDSLNGISYISKVSAGRDDSGKQEFIENSYKLSGIFKHEDKIISTSCSIAGVDYKSYISICEKIAESFYVK